MTWSHPSTHPPIHPPTNEWGSLHRFQIFKQNWNILITSSAIEFWLIPGVPLGVAGGGWIVIGGGERVPPTHMQMHACGVCAWAYDIIGNSQVFPQWGWPFAWNYHVYHACMCMCVHVHVCACMCMCVGAPQPPPPQSTHPHHPQSSREPRSPKFNKSWTNRDNSILFEDSLPLNAPELI